MKKTGFFFIILLGLTRPMAGQEIAPSKKPLRVGVIGLVHDHVNWILGREKRNDIEIVGIAENDRELAVSYAKKYGFNINLVYPTMEEMIEKTKPEAVLAFNNIYDHLNRLLEFRYEVDQC